jgi:hypothetical protein
MEKQTIKKRKKSVYEKSYKEAMEAFDYMVWFKTKRYNKKYSLILSSLRLKGSPMKRSGIGMG